MRRFDNIVLSENEPMKRGSLWLKRKRQTPYNNDSKEKMKYSLSVWYYGNYGWESIIDFDTRYNINTVYDYDAGQSAVSITERGDIDKGTVTYTANIALYDGTRAIGGNTNLVVEKGLKKHVDSLQNQIDTINVKIAGIENKIASIEDSIVGITSAVGQLNSSVTSLSSSINSLNSRVSALENN